MLNDEQVGFNVTDEVVVGDLEVVKEQRNIKPKAQGVHVRIEKAAVKKQLSDGSKEAPKEGPNNPVAYKYLNCSFRILEGISVPVYDEAGNPTGETAQKFKNSVIFPNKMDLIFWHNPEVKTADWWKNKQYIFGFKALCKAVGADTKNITINDEFLSNLNSKEVLIDIEHEEEQEQKLDPKTGENKWTGKGTFKERIKNIRQWS